MNFYLIALLVVVCNFESNAQHQSCGLSKYKERIVGGHESQRLAWPWQAQFDIEFSNFIFWSGEGECGGSLIHPQWVLSAAHCFKREKWSQSLKGVKVIFGAHNTSNEAEETRIVLKAAEIVIHPRYVHWIKGYDIALIKLERALEFDGKDSQLAPVCLPEAGRETQGDKCVATGWGRLSSGGEMAEILQEVTLPKIEDSECKRQWGSKVDESQLCAGYVSGGKDTCKGDSGGPLQCPMYNGVWVLEGITSFGKKCAKAGPTTVYTKVAHYRHWIQEVIAKNE